MKDKSKEAKFAVHAADDPALSSALCSTCNHANGCTTTRGKTNMKVLRCEEFDDYQPLPPLSLKAAPSTFPTASLNSHRGLCVTCTYVTSCTFPKPHGGVWHCEEYQ
jgi:hypothetical protein